MAVAGARGRCRRPASSFFNGPNNIWRPSTAHTKWRRICAQQPRSKFARHASHAPRPRGGNRTLRRSEICSRGCADIVSSRATASACNGFGWADARGQLDGQAQRREVFRPGGSAILTMVLQAGSMEPPGVCARLGSLPAREAIVRTPPIHRQAPDSGESPRSKPEPPPAPNHQYRRLQKPR